MPSRSSRPRRGAVGHLARHALATALLAGACAVASCSDDTTADATLDCPLALPASGAACPRDNVYCTYGRADCPTAARCRSGRWELATSACAPPPTCEPAGGTCSCTCAGGAVRDPSKTCAQTPGTCASVCCVPGPDAAPVPDASPDGPDAGDADAMSDADADATVDE